MSNELTTDYLLLGLSLYEKRTIDDIELIFNFFSQNVQFDCYCISCKRESTFKKSIHIPLRVDRNTHPFDTRIIGEFEQVTYKRSIQGEHKIGFQCQRENGHSYSFHFKVIDNKIMKIGQYPSIADLELHKIKKYRPLLKEDYKDFSKAIGLYSHGVGAGSYVYLRRIFENLIVEQKDIALKSDPSLTETDFNEKRMDEKILYIKDYLPESLVTNRKIYSILSKGIHELSEDECLSMFPSLELGIEIILDWKLAEKEKQDKESQLAKFVSKTIEKFK